MPNKSRRNSTISRLLEQTAQRDADEAAKVAERAAKAEDEARVERVKEAGPDLPFVVRWCAPGRACAATKSARTATDRDGKSRHRRSYRTRERESRWQRQPKLHGPGQHFNPWWGCSKVGPGCDHCYAEALDRRTGGDHWGADKTPRTMSGDNWRKPVRWQRIAEAERCSPPSFLWLNVRLG